MKKTLTLLFLMALNIPCYAATSRLEPNGTGGFNSYNSNGTYSRTESNGLGGFNVYNSDGTSSRVESNGMGGYNIYHSE